MKKIDGDLAHSLLLNEIKPKFSLSKATDISAHKKALKSKFIELIGYDKVLNNAVPLKIEIEQDVDKGEYRQIRFVFESEKGAFVPCSTCPTVSVGPEHKSILEQRTYF